MHAQQSTYEVSYSFTGHATARITADTPEEALEKFLTTPPRGELTVDRNCQYQVDNIDVAKPLPF